jgi:hypothetical protein
MKFLIFNIIILFFISSSYAHEPNKSQKNKVTYENHYHKSYKNFKK